MKFFSFLHPIRRYQKVIRYYWKNRHHQKIDFFNKQEAEFLPSGLSLQENPDSPTLRWTGRLLMTLVGLSLVWAILGKVDIIVNADGKIIPSSRTKVIASLETASVQAIHVTEGQNVKPGDVLIELNSSGSDAEYNKASDMVSQAKLQILLSQVLLNAIDQNKPVPFPFLKGVKQTQWEEAKKQLESQYQEFHVKFMRINEEILHFSEVLPLVEKRAKDYKDLMEEKLISYHAFMEKEQARIDFQAQLKDAYRRREELLAQVRKEAQKNIVESNKLIESAQQDQRRSKEHSRLLKLIAPVEGTVQQLAVHTLGGIVPAADPLMHIVPKNNAIEIEAFLENKDVGFVHVGQDAEIKIQAFDYTKYGTLKGRVSHVSQDAIQDEKRGLIYSVKILLLQHNLMVEGHVRTLFPGMSVGVDIKTGTRRIIEYIFSPLLKHRHEALHER